MLLITPVKEAALREYVETVCTHDQRERFYAFRRCKFHHPTIRRLAMASTNATAISKTVPLVLSAISRSYLSEILVLARNAMIQAGELPDGVLQPHFLREGYRQFHVSGRGFPPTHLHPIRKRMF